MGIKFLCPNGHKLNVKSFLAGKKAICPKCGAKVMVPGQSAEAEDPGEGGHVASPAAGVPPGLADAAFGAGTVPRTPASSGAGAFLQPNLHPLQPGRPASEPATAMTDPIEEAPTAVWYVRPPSGGQYGPAAGPTMRAWIQEGRVTANSLVWRDGWPEWRSAAATFPSLAAPQQQPWGPAAVAPGAAAQPVAPAGVPIAGWQPAAAAPVVPAGMVPMAMPVAPHGNIPLGHVMSALETPLAGYDAPADEEFPSRARKRRGKKGPDVTTYVALALVIMTVVLVVVLAVVLIKQRSATEEPGPEAKSVEAQVEEPAGEGAEMQEGKAAEGQPAAESKKKPKKGAKPAADAADEKM